MKRMSHLIFLSLLIVVLSACEKGVGDVDVLNSHGSIEGLEKMVHFYDNVQNGVPSDLRIVHYTIEGDPIITDLSYDGKSFEVTYDTTRDKFGSGEITIIKCGNLIQEVNPTNTAYIAVDCEDDYYGMQEILSIDYNVSQQDLFEFELKYGSNQENEIDTLTNTVKNDNGTQTVGDLKITPEVKQEVYKRLVFANYLAPKDLSTKCDGEDATNYYLKVHINGGQREFKWNACDQSSDGVKFTNIANYIIEQSAKKQKVQREITVQGYVLEIKNNEMLIGEDLTMLDYEWMKDELQSMNFEDNYYHFTLLEGVDTKVFKPGDKILATIDGSIVGSKPGRAKVKGIKKIEVH
ncbi:DUF4362 domain-containing protein [Lysinibacillus sp. 54212]|uniref:DUF4362 domain-containing protein n=1 Tax=Lysinibacillus sp. 54212 TaxID=3119829 RepID=UPI002FC9A174